MKPQFLKRTGRIGAILPLASLILGNVLVPSLATATEQVYTNAAILTTPPQIDAVNVVNLGTMSFGLGGPSDFPFDQSIDPFLFRTASTLNWTNTVSLISGVVLPNSGIMEASPGFMFDWEPVSFGQARPSANFFNDDLGIIAALDLNAPTIVQNEPSRSALYGSKLVVNATNIISHGLLQVGANGSLELTGQNVELRRGLLSVVPAHQEVVSYTTSSNYFLTGPGIDDVYWVATNFTQQNQLNSGGLWDGTTATAPAPAATPIAATAFILPAPFADSYVSLGQRANANITVTNQDGTTTRFTVNTNITKGAVFALGPDWMDRPQLGFTFAQDGSAAADVLFTATMTNLATTLTEQVVLSFVDSLASSPGRGLKANALTVSTFCPTNYMVARQALELGGSGLGVPPADFFIASGQVIDPTISSDGVTNASVQAGSYSAYSPFIDNIVSRAPLIAAGTETNLPGRIRISADNLDLTKTRLRGEGEIMLKSVNLISSTGTVVDVENLSFDLSSQSGTLKFENLSKDNVTGRVRGQVLMWSAVWSNVAEVIFNSYTISNDTSQTNDAGETITNVVATLSPITNNVIMKLHAFMLDARPLTNVLPVTTFELITRTPDVVINDNVSVVRSLLFTNAQSLTLNGNFTIPGVYPALRPADAAAGLSVVGSPGPGIPPSSAVQSWVYSNAPNLLYFTNNASLTISNEAHFGDDRAFPYSNFVNSGSVFAGATIRVNSTYIENTGDLSSPGTVFFQSSSARFDSGSTTAGGSVQFISSDLKLNNYALQTEGFLNFVVTGSLFDGGPGTATSIETFHGFNLLVKPLAGDLLYTTFSSVAPFFPSIQVSHVWAAEDRGATANGYVNNEAIGVLALSTEGPDPTFRFSGTGVGAHNGMYVDLLDLSALGANFLSQIEIDPNLTIYFAAAKVPAAFTLPLGPNGRRLSPEEYLDGKLGGRLRWVQCFAGPNSSVPVLINGQTYMVNKALFNSTQIDSDGDTIPNASDPTPFSSPPCGSAAFAGTTFVSIDSPAQGQAVFTPSATLRGSAGTTSGNAWVYYNLNGTGWMPASSANGGADWSANLNLKPGANVIQAFAAGGAGDVSATNSVSVLYTPGAPLSLSVQGSGSVEPYTNGQWLALDSTYTIRAHAGSGAVFSSWSGAYNSSEAQLTFIMKSNVALTANFVAQPYTPAAASYSGLFRQSDDVRLGKSGSFDITTTSSGQYSGAIQIGANRYSIRGSIDASGSATNTIIRKGASTLTLVFQIDTTSNARITGTVGDGTWTADLSANRVSGVSAVAARYTLLLPGEENLSDHSKPQGSGFATVTVNAVGSVQVSGELADGTKFSDSGSLSDDGACALYIPLYSGGGQLFGWLSFSNTAEKTVQGELTWIKQAGAKGKNYPAGFDLEVDAHGAVYANTPGASILGANSASLVLVGGSLSTGITNVVTIDASNKVGVPAGSGVKLTLVTPQGLFKGSVSGPNGTIKFSGAILQNETRGAGYFLSGGESGNVSLSP